MKCGGYSVGAGPICWKRRNCRAGVFDAPPGSDFRIGEKLEIIPNHACPTCNLYDVIYGVRRGVVEDCRPVLARGKSQ